LRFGFLLAVPTVRLDYFPTSQQVIDNYDDRYDEQQVKEPSYAARRPTKEQANQPDDNQDNSYSP
jgi:hypothetical protein